MKLIQTTGPTLSELCESHSVVSFKVRRGASEEIPLIQGKEQQLCFAGAGMKRYPTSKVKETQVKRYVLQEARRTETIITEN